MEICNETDVKLGITDKLLSWLENEVKEGKPWQDDRPGFFTGQFYDRDLASRFGYCDDKDLSSHFGFCDDNKIKAILSVNMEILFIDYV